MKALVFGVSGQDGALLARFLVDKGYEVYGTSRDAQIGSFDNLRKLGIAERVIRHSAVLTDFRSVVQVLDRTGPDEVYFLAGQSSVSFSFEQPAETLESIALGTLNLLEAVRFLDLPVRLYNAGSSECFGELDLPADETTPFRPRSPYAVAKASAHWMVANYREAYGLHASTGILFNHESPLRPARFVTRKVVAAACRIAGGSGERLSLGNLRIKRDWGWAPEYVRAMWLMLQQDQPGDYVIATGVSHSLEAFVDIAFREHGLQWRDHVDIDASLRRVTDVEHSVGCARKAADIFAWSARFTLRDTIRAMTGAEQGLPWPVVASRDGLSSGTWAAT